mgnify:CR=1 FL=1
MVDVKGYVVAVFEGLDAEDVVYVCVGVDDGLGGEVVVVYMGDEVVCLGCVIHSGVYNPALVFFV